jgi:hypothetical protein
MSRLRLLLVFVLVFTAFTVAAQTSFVIERVEAVSGARIRPAIVLKSRTRAAWHLGIRGPGLRSRAAQSTTEGLAPAVIRFAITATSDPAHVHFHGVR